MNAPNWMVVSDFDGTISLRDVTDLLLERFAKDGWLEIEAAWERGEIGSRECMAGQIALLDLGKAELDDWLTKIEIDPAFIDFVSSVRSRDIPLIVASDGVDYVIRSVLQRHGLGSITIVANHLVQTGERSWRLDFPHAHDLCRAASGMCKCALLRGQQHDYRVLYIGDGASDFCVSHQADAVLAKDKLIQYAQQESIAHVPIADFKDAASILHRLQQDDWLRPLPTPVA